MLKVVRIYFNFIKLIENLSINNKMSYLHFTTQQLQGGGKYSVKSKIGNWYEDMVMDEIK